MYRVDTRNVAVDLATPAWIERVIVAGLRSGYSTWLRLRHLERDGEAWGLDNPMQLIIAPCDPLGFSF